MSKTIPLSNLFLTIGGHLRTDYKSTRASLSACGLMIIE